MRTQLDPGTTMDRRGRVRVQGRTSMKRIVARRAPLSLAVAAVLALLAGGVVALRPAASAADCPDPKARQHRWTEEAWNRRNPAVIDELYTPDVVLHGMALSTPGAAGLKQLMAAFYHAFPDAHMTDEEIIVEGDRVATRWTFRGTQQGEFFGIPATGRRITVTGIAIDRVVGCRVAERWLEYDQLGMLQQLGVLPPPSPAAR